ncbi:VOC family protein [Streptomyces sp. NPDC005573]|uniref:VOC family protein n=1 Tax=Streptomyces sp. NPDC005573 TaxID=3156890 RepID=UPI0033A76EB4
MFSIRWTYAFADRPAARLADAGAFWTAVTGTRLSEPRGDQGEFMTLLPCEAGSDACLKLQGVDGEGGAHLDLCVDDVPALVRGARELGATLVADHGDWTVLRSPGGQLFCAVPWHGEAVRQPVAEGSRPDQVCLDVPPSVYEAETAFWSALTGWDRVRGTRPEFLTLVPPAGLPVRILLQRLAGERAPSAHLDLACADLQETRARHEGLGAVFVAGHPHWAVMRDPSGGTYCLTGRHPVTGEIPAARDPQDV